MDQVKINQLEAEIASSIASIRKALSEVQAITGALDVFIYQLKKETSTLNPEEALPPK